MSTKSPNRALRWANFFIALMLVLAIENRQPLSQAQAASSSEVVTWYLDVANPKTKICVGQTVEYSTTVHYNYLAGETEWAISGVTVEATSSDKSVGTFKKDSAITGLANIDLVTASFSFLAKKPGKTNLYFEALADKKFTSTYVSFTVPVTVIPCKFKVIATSQMSQCYPGGCIKFKGVIVEGQVTADENGYYVGEAPVVWISTSQVPNCGAVNLLGIGKVKMRGNLNESGELVLELVYQPVSFTDTIKCPFGSGIGATPINISPLNVTVSTQSKLTAVKLNQQLSGGPGPIGGTANVYVIPLDGVK